MKQMLFTQRSLNGANGLTFHKMLGTGGGAGYSSKPDFGTYALLTVWDEAEMAHRFEPDSAPMRNFSMHAKEVYSIFLSPISSRGLWSGRQPFVFSEPDPENPLITVLTRATLKARYYIPFWNRVGGVSRSHENARGLIFSKGVGERPWIMQATFTIWKSVKDMEAFAHDRGGRHYEAIAKTRRLKGFKEELYARFQPFDSRGTWKGEDPLGEQLASLKGR